MLCVESEELSSSCRCRTLSLSRTFESFLFLRSKFYSLFRENVTIQFSLRSLTSSFCLVFTYFSSCWAFAVPFSLPSSAHLHNASRLSRFEHRSHHVEQRRRRLWQSYGYRWAAGIPHHRRSRLFHADYHLSCKYCLSTKHKLLIPPRDICNLHLDFACMLFSQKVKENTRAQRACLKLGDAILSINGKSTEHMTLREANRCLANAASREVTLHISKWVSFIWWWDEKF